MRLHQKLLIHALLGHFLLVVIFYIFLFSFLKIYLEKSLISRSQIEAKALFSSLYQGMLKGFTREELENFLRVFQTDKLRVSLEEPLEIKEIPLDKEYVITKKGDILYIRYYITAKKNCLNCHRGIKEGDLIGALVIENSLKEDLKEIHRTLLLFLLFFSLFPLLGVYFVGKFQGKKLVKPIEELKERIRKSSKFDELIESEDLLESSKTGIYEFDGLLEITDDFLRKVKELAIDREIFKFELSLLEKFIITSEFIRDWKYYVSNLLIEVNKIVEIVSIFALFYVEDDLFDAEIFWFKNPTRSFKEDMEGMIRKIFLENFKVNNFNFIHNVVLADESYSEDAFKNFYFKTKSLILESPKIGGIVGIGLFHEKLTSTQEIAIETVLTSLLNVIGSIRAINKYTKELEFYATRDPLTHLYNQRTFWELLEYEVERAKRYNYKFALLIVDLDNFKLINDTYGHSFGDEFLREFAKFLEEIKRKGDILARYGGDEFTLILPLCDLTQAVSVAERIKENLSNFKIEAPDGKPVFLTTSIGIAIFPDHGETSKDLFTLADTLMYKAKKEGKNKIVYPTAEEILSYQKEITDTILLVKEAVENKRILPYFQPIYDLKTGELFGCEVLMRIEIEDEVIPAQRFIGIAESMGFIMEMDFINMEKALSLAKETNYQGYFFFNLSPKVLIVPEFLKKIKELVKNYSFPSEKIIFELTERETVKNLTLLEKFIRNLQDYGFKFCIDDFGSGFSSFQYIKHFIIDFVKIEGDFVIGLSREALIDLAIIESIVTLCKRLNIKVIAEYVESEELVSKLRDFGVEFGQGFHLGKPSPQLPLTSFKSSS